MAEIVDFQEAIKLTEGEKRHLLLGNGFSRSCKENIFSYGSLLNQADFSKLSKELRLSFDALKTTDFEAVIKGLLTASTILNVYKQDDTWLVRRLKEESSKLKELLVNTIANSHPNNPSEITDDEFLSCRSFLSHFNRFYTLNYDLLLYWTFMHKEEKSDDRLKCDDGFRHPEDEDYSDYVTWEIENTNSQNVYYLHGALHLFESETEVKKFTWNRTGVSLLNQINEALNDGFYPVIVAEGSSDQKVSRIMRSGYLQRGLKSLTSITGNLFTFGFSFSKNDEHILHKVRKSRINTLWVGLYGDSDSKANKAIMACASNLKNQPRGKRRSASNLNIRFYNAESASPWGKV